MVRATVLSSPGAVPAAPLSVGLESPVGEGAGLIDTSGGVVSTVKVTASLLPTSDSPCSATAVYSPGPRAGASVTSQPSDAGGNAVVAVRTGEPIAFAPAYRLSVTGSRRSSVVPLTVGV